MIASERGEVGLAAGMDLLKVGGSAMDAAEAAVRVDSALIGAGNYCDNRFGAAACTGRGELAIRASTARCAVLALASGMDPVRACTSVLAEAAELPDDFRAPLQVLCLTPDGRHAGASTKPGSTYSVITAADDTYRTEERAHI